MLVKKSAAAVKVQYTASSGALTRPSTAVVMVVPPRDSKLSGDLKIRDRIHREIAVLQTTAQLHLPHIMKAWGIFVTRDDRLCTVMELCDCSLDYWLLWGQQYVDSRKGHDDWRVQNMAFECCRCVMAEEVVRAVHEMQSVTLPNGFKIIHRDLKAANFLVHRVWDDVLGWIYRLKLTDWGLVGFEDPTKMTVFVSGCGTPGHVAPETARRGRASSTQSDLWGMGATLLSVFDLQSNLEMIRKIRERGKGASSTEMRHFVERTCVRGREWVFPYLGPLTVNSFFDKKPDRRTPAHVVLDEMHGLIPSLTRHKMMKFAMDGAFNEDTAKRAYFWSQCTPFIGKVIEWGQSRN